MAIIGKIRERSVLVIVIVGLSLALFILGDFLTNPSTGRGDYNIGTIYGEPVDEAEYLRRVENAFAQKEQELAQRNQPFTDIVKDQERDKVWNSYMIDMVLQHEVELLPISVSAEELNDLVHGENIHPFILNIPRFYDPMGQFSRDSVGAFLRQLEGADPEFKQQWREFEKDIKKNRAQMKYINMIQKAAYVTTAEAKKAFDEENRFYSVRFVVKKYFDVTDSMVKVTDDDIRAFYEKNKNRKQYELPGSRAFEYIEIPVVPTDADKEAIKKELAQLTDAFKNSKDDSMFVMQYADNKYFANRFSGAGEFPNEIDSLIQNADSGDVIGPYEQFGFYRMTKIRGIKKETEKEARVRHILLSKENGDMESLRKKADSIRTVIKKNKNFEEMVVKFSDDPGSKTTGGVYEWFGEGRMVKAFNDASFNGKVGDMTIVETEYGVHLVEVLGQRNAKRVNYATIDMKIRPGAETEAIAKEQAIAFVDGLGGDAAKFAEYAQKQKMTVLENEVFQYQRTLNNDETSREFIRWVLAAAEGDISDAIGYGDKVVVAHITNIKPKGTPEFEDVKEIMEIPTRQEKKAEMLMKQMQNAKSIEEVATRVNEKVIEAKLNFGSTTIVGGGGNEPEVIGTIFSLTANNKGSLTVPIKGKIGVYVVQLVEITEPPQTADYSTKKKAMTTSFRQMVESDVINALKENAKIVDSRPVY